MTIGGSDAGIGAALRAREVDPTWDVTVLLSGDGATPALVVDEQVVLSGHVPTAASVREILEPLARWGHVPTGSPQPGALPR